MGLFANSNVWDHALARAAVLWVSPCKLFPAEPPSLGKEEGLHLTLLLRPLGCSQQWTLHSGSASCSVLFFPFILPSWDSLGPIGCIVALSLPLPYVPQACLPWPRAWSHLTPWCPWGSKQCGGCFSLTLGHLWLKLLLSGPFHWLTLSCGLHERGSTGFVGLASLPAFAGLTLTAGQGWRGPLCYEPRWLHSDTKAHAQAHLKHWGPAMPAVSQYARVHGAASGQLWAYQQ